MSALRLRSKQLRCTLLCLGLLLPWSSSAQVLVREVISREHALHVDHEQDPQFKQVISRELTLHVEAGTATSYAQVISREVTAMVDAVGAPAAVTGIQVTVSPDGTTAQLDWSAYNQWAEGDIVRFDIYFSSAGPLANVTGLTPFLSVGVESIAALLTGLPAGQDHFFAVVAVDALGNFNPVVNYAAGYVLSPEAISRELTLFVGADPVPAYAQAISREVTLSVDSPGAPSAVANLALQVSPDGTTATLDWSAYNQGAERDIARFDIYLSDAGPFSNVTGLTPFLSVGGETTALTLAGLTANQDHFFAVVAVDAFGNFLPVVNYAAAYVLSPQAISRELSLFVGEEPASPYAQAISRELVAVMPDATTPAPVTGAGSGFIAATSQAQYRAIDLDWSSYNELAQQDVVRYRVYLDTSFFTSVTGMTPFTFVPAGTLRTTLTGLAGNQTYYSAVVAEDIGGNFNPTVLAASAQSSENEIWQPNNQSVTYNGAILLDATTIRAAGTLQVNATTDTGIVRVEFFVRSANSADVLLANDITPADGFTAVWNAGAFGDGGYVFTFRAYGVTGRATEITRTVTLIFNHPPLIAGMTFAGANLVDNATIVRSGRVGVAASDSDGLLIAEFFRQPAGGGPQTPIGSDNTPANGFDVLWNVENLDDGAYDLIARVYDGLGAVSESSRRVNLALAVPAAPVIISPVGSTTVTTASVEVRGTAPVGPALKIYRNDVVAFTGTPGADGSFAAQVPLVVGANVLAAESSNRAGAGPRSNSVTVTREEAPPIITIALDQPSVVEGGALGGTVSIAQTRNQPLTVSLGVSQTNRLTFPASVVIPAGQTSAPFGVEAVQNANIESAVSVTLIALAPGATAATANLQILDDDTPAIQLTLDRDSVSEAGGSQAVRGTLTITPPANFALTATFTATPPGQLVLPASVPVPANATTVQVPIGVLDNTLVDGAREVSIVARLVPAGGGAALAEAPAVPLEITDDDGPTLVLSFDRTLLLEGANPAATGTVTRTPVSSKAVTVTLASSDTGKVLVPATVTIAANKPSATFALQAVANGQPDGNRSVEITATAAGLSPATAGLTLTDLQKPDLVVEVVAPPAGAETEAWIDVRFVLRNQGATAATGPFTQRILLSTDPLPGGDTLLTQSDFTGVLPGGAQFEQSLRVRLPRDAGRYWLVVETDANGAIDEALENNNVAAAATATDIKPAYATTLAIIPPTVPSNTPIPITGSATLRGGGPAAYALVNIHITNSGIKRVISALTNALGQFTASFTPLPGEGGLFQFGAAHPGLASAPVQDEVRVYGLRADPVALDLKLAENTPLDGEIILQNLADLPVTGLQVAVVGLPAGVQFAPQLSATNLAPSGTVTLDYTVSAAAPLAATSFTINLTSIEGAALAIPAQIAVAANQPALVAEPGELVAGMLRGQQQFVTFTLRNNGSTVTGPLNLLLPSGAPWLRIATPLPLPPLAPGESIPVTLQLLPAADLPLEEYTGRVVATDGAVALSVPFKLRALSNQTGRLLVRAEDEYTYYAQGNPPLAGATVTVSDALTRQPVATLTTGADGRLDFGQLREGYYEIDATADRHAGYRATTLLRAGQDNEVRAFLSRQTVTYQWTVEPTQVEDRYKVTIDTTFETNVPIPVITIEPAVIDLAEITAAETVVNVKVTNHGLIAANEMRLNLPVHPSWEFVPLVRDFGILSAKSSITVPVTIRKLPAGGAALARTVAFAPQAAGGGDCHLFASACGTIVCGPLKVTICGTLAMPNAGTGCGGGGPIPVAGGGGCVDCGTARGTGSTASGGKVVPCDPLCPVLAALGCVPGPVGCFFSGYGCGSGLADPNLPPAQAWLDCGFAAVGCLVPGGGIPGCIYSFMRCFVQPIAAPPAPAAVPGKAAAAAVVDPIDQFKPGIRAGLDAFNEITGAPDGVWINAQADAATGEWMIRFQNAANIASDGGRNIASTERAELLAGIQPPGVPSAEVNRVVDRWNRTQENWARGIFRRANTPEGESTDFIDAEALRVALVAAAESQALAEAAGYSDPINAIVEIARFRDSQGASGGICGRVKLRLEQEAVLTRDAFRAALDLENKGPTGLENVQVDITMRPESGGPGGELFDIRLEGVSVLTAVDGSGTLAVTSDGTARWLIVPTIDAAPDVPTRYLVGGTLRYRVDGVDVTIPLGEVAITVLPSPRLTLKYYHQRDVFSDDPFTDVVEPAIPYSLAVLVQNNGAGVAQNFRITSAQPKIIENEKGLLADFKIIATQVAGQSLQPSLTADFGNIQPGEIKIGEWLLTSSIHGLFIDYEATFEHLDGRGNPRLSLIDGVEIYEMIRKVEALGDFDDGRPDFLINNVPDVRDLADTLHFSDGTTAPVAVVETAQVSGQVTPAQLTVQIAAPLPAGWAYLRIPDPSNGQYLLTSVVRSDGREIPVDVNAWVTDRTFLGQGRRPTYEFILHLLDHDSPGSYTLTYQSKLAPDSIAPSSFVRALPAQSPVEFAVTWEGSDNRGVAFFDLFVSVDGGAYVPWLERTSLTGALFRGELGHTYAFYSRAADAAGNREAAPALADASTAVSLVNAPPTLAQIADQQVTEGATFVHTLSATDPDGPAGALRFGFTSAVPPGLTLNAVTGELRWATGENDGGRDVEVTVQVTDGGVPAASATRTFRLLVVEQNEPPLLATVAAQRAVVRVPFTLQMQAEDPDRPAQVFQFRLGAGSPAGMTIDATSGLLAWTPPASFAEQNVPVTVIVSDDGNPATEHAQTFLLAVDPALTNGGESDGVIKQPATDAPPVGSSSAAFDVAAAGTYAGLLVGEDTNPDARGFFTATIGKKGTFTGSVRIGGVAQAVKGTLAADGSLAVTKIVNKDRTVVLALALRRTAAGGWKLAGTVTDTVKGVISGFDADLQKAVVYSAKAPSPLAGSYTLLAVHDERVQPDEPQGHGYATMAVSKLGRITAAGLLADGTRFTQGGVISVDGEWPFFADLYSAKPRGFLAGPIRFRDVPAVSDFDGTLLWRRPALPKAPTFKLGFTLTRTLIGSKYAKPGKNERSLKELRAQTGNVSLALEGDPIPAGSGPWTMTWDARHALLYNGTEKISGKVTPTTGAFTGSFSTVTPKVALKFGGVVFQKQGFAAGCFTTPGKTGQVLLDPQ